MLSGKWGRDGVLSVVKMGHGVLAKLEGVLVGMAWMHTGFCGVSSVDGLGQVLFIRSGRWSAAVRLICQREQNGS